jgi:hypothetical protein
VKHDRDGVKQAGGCVLTCFYQASREDERYADRFTGSRVTAGAGVSHRALQSGQVDLAGLRMTQIDPWVSGSRIRSRDDFVSGLKCFRNEDREGALGFFRSADDQAEMDDIYQNRYTSCHGLARVHMGDRNGVKLCRELPWGSDPMPKYYNLSVAGHKPGFRESACTALRRGLTIDAGHAGLMRLKQECRLREQWALIPGLRRDHFLSRVLGRLFRGSRTPLPERGR